LLKRLGVGLPSSRLFFALCLGLSLHKAAAQQAISSIEQSRLFQQTPAPTSTNVTADGMALPASGSTSDDDSFGDQVILKSQPRLPTFVVSGDASFFYTDNVALTGHDRRDDTFLVGRVAAVWMPRIAPTLEAQVSASASTFRYNNTSELDFTNLSLGAGLSWTPQNLRGVVLFARYDFIELLNRHSDEILQGHEFTVGAQKVFALGRSHAISVGAFAMVGFANPDEAQRDQVGVFAGYRLMLTRAFEADVQYRLAGQFYNDAERNDLNQVLSLNLRYRITPWAEANASFSFGNNRSDHSVFDYNVVNTGAGVGLSVRF
jgi:hypothetical protein